MKQDVLTTYYSDDGDRMAEVFKDKYHYGVFMYEKETKAWGHGQYVRRRTELLENHSISYAEDLAENYVKKWGAFKDVN